MKGREMIKILFSIAASMFLFAGCGGSSTNEDLNKSEKFNTTECQNVNPITGGCED